MTGSTETSDRLLASRAYAALRARIAEARGVVSTYCYDDRPAIGIRASTQAEWDEGMARFVRHLWRGGPEPFFALLTPTEQITIETGSTQIDGRIDHIIVDAPPRGWKNEAGEVREVRPTLTPAHADAIVEQVACMHPECVEHGPCQPWNSDCKRPALAVIGEVGCGNIACAGTGRVQKMVGEVWAPSNCPDCHGTGRVPYTYKGKRWLEVTR